MISALVLALVGPQSAIDLRLPATRLPNLIPILARETRRKLEFDAALQDEVLLIAVKGVSSEALLDRVAKATSATWVERDGDRLVLTRTKGEEERQRKEWVEARIAVLKKAYDAFQKNALPSKTDWSEDDARAFIGRMAEAGMMSPITDEAQFKLRQSLEGKTSGARLLARLLDSIDVTRIASAEPTDKVVFCSAPTRSQAAFSGQISAAISSYTIEQATFAKAASGLTRFPFDDALIPVKPLSGNPTRARLIVTDLGLSFHLQLYGDGESPITAMRMSLPAPTNPASQLDETMKPFGPTLIKQPPENVEFNNAIQAKSASPSKPWTPVEGALRAKMLDPEMTDPLSFSATSGMMQVIEATKTNFVGVIPDSFIYGGTSIGTLSVAGKFKIKDGWLESQPSTYDTRARRLPRKLLGEYARSISSAGIATLEASLMIVRAGMADSSDYRRRLLHGYETAIGAPTRYDSLSSVAAEILDACTQDQLNSLLAGNPMPMSALPIAARARIHNKLLRSSTENLFGMLNRDSLPQISGSLWPTEATQGWPEAVPSDAILTIAATHSPYFSDVDAIPRFVMALPELSYTLASRQKGTQQTQRYEPAHRLVVAENTTYRIMIANGNLSFLANFAGYEIKPGTKPVLYADLPNELKTRVEELRDRYFKSMGGD